MVGNQTLFRAISGIGHRLVQLHLLEDKQVNKPVTRFAGRAGADVAVGYPKFTNGKIMINSNRWFEEVPQKVWDFHIGGYQVCEKWLKDRRGRTLSQDDIEHYEKILVAISETIR